MKIYMTFKTPDAVDYMIEEEVAQAIERHKETHPEADEEELDIIRIETKNELEKCAKQWIRGGEYITVELDTSNGTCKVLRA